MSKGRNLGLAARVVGVINVHSSSTPHWGANDVEMIALWRSRVKLEFGQDHIFGSVLNVTLVGAARYREVRHRSRTLRFCGCLHVAV